MTPSDINNFIDKLSIILMQPFNFLGIEINVNDIIRASHHKNWKVDAHHHPWFEFNYVATGSVFTTINKKEFLVSAGQSYIIPPGISHSHRHNKTGDDGICIRFSLDSDSQNKIYDTLQTLHEIPFDSNIEDIRLCGGLYSIQAEFATWLMWIYDIWNKDAAPVVEAPNTFSHQVILYLEEYYHEKVNIDDIAKALNTSRRTLARKFKAESGMTIFDKLTQIRIDNAKELLISTKLSLYQIAIQCGYTNEFYFSKIFKLHEKISPKYYRMKYDIKLD